MGSKKNVLLIFGGASPEYEVSCGSAAGIIDNIDLDKYNLHVVGITKKGEWIYTKANSNDIKDSYKWINEKTNKKATLAVDMTKNLLIFNEDGSINVEKINVVFPIIHGENGEDGTIQGLFEIAGLPYVGSGVCASACSMDKVITRIFAEKIKILQPKCYITDSNSIDKDENLLIEKIENCVGNQYPKIVKPSMTGSSIGISKVNNKEELINAINIAAQYKGKIMVEEYIVGSEIKVAVLENKGIVTGDLCEITVQEGCFNDYSLKYKGSGAHKKIPAPIDSEIAEKIRNEAIKIFKELNCKDYARVDFFLTKDNKVYFNEINTIPGFSAKSIFTLMINNIGIDYSKLISILIDNNL